MQHQLLIAKRRSLRNPTALTAPDASAGWCSQTERRKRRRGSPRNRKGKAWRMGDLKRKSKSWGKGDINMEKAWRDKEGREPRRSVRKNKICSHAIFAMSCIQSGTWMLMWSSAKIEKSSVRTVPWCFQWIWCPITRMNAMESRNRVESRPWNRILLRPF